MAKTKLPTVLTDEELARLLAPRAIGDRRSGVYARDRMLLLLLAGSGLRVGEATGLARDWLDLAGKSPCLRVPQECSKAGPGRTVYLGGRIAGELAAYVAALPTEQQALFVTRTGRSLDPSHVRRLCKKVARRAGLSPSRVHPHALRHTYARRWLEAGENLLDLSRQLGHERVQTTSLYLRVASPYQADAAVRADL